jgi:dTDP-4-amino-4,6-dideoxygalactose transaminase
MSEDGMEQKYVKEAFDTNWVVPLGPNVNGFEKDLEEFVNDSKKLEEVRGSHKKLDDNTLTKRVVALSSGTAAVHLGLLNCGVKAGDEVIVQSFTFCASTHPVTYLGATPVLVDSEPDTWNIDPELLEEAIKDRKAKTGKYPKAIVPVALYGMPYKADRIMEIANKYGIPVVEDAAEGFGSRYKGQVLGTFGKYGVLSFNGNKMITTSGGGALITANDDEWREIMMYATQYRESYPYYQHEKIGYNYRMSNICAGIGRGQMTVVNDHLAHHKHVQKMYEELLADVPGVKVHSQPNATLGSGPKVKSDILGTGPSVKSQSDINIWASPEKGTDVPVYDSNYWLCTITIDENVKVKGQEDAYKTIVTGAVGGAAGVIHAAASAHTDCEPNSNVEAMRVALDQAQIEARPVWKPMHKQPCYKDVPAYVNGVSEALFKVGMCLPAGPYVSDDDVRYIVDTIKENIIG